VAAPKKPKQPRPTEAQIFRAQKRIIAYLAKTEKTFNQAAEDAFGVSPTSLRRFLFQPRQKTRRGYRRSFDAQDIYAAATKTKAVKKTVTVTKGAGRGLIKTVTVNVPQGIGEIAKIPRITIRRSITKEGEIVERVSITGVSDTAARRASIMTHAAMIEAETPAASMNIAWQLYTSRYDIPDTMEGIRAKFDDGEYSARDIRRILNHWAVIYSIDDDHLESFMDENYWDLEDYEDEEYG